VLTGTVLLIKYRLKLFQQNKIKAAKRYADKRLADRSGKPALRQALDKLGSL